jgi:hypothetical protein
MISTLQSCGRRVEMCSRALSCFAYARCSLEVSTINLQGIIAQHQELPERGAIVSVVEGQARVRLLPIGGEERK